MMKKTSHKKPTLKTSLKKNKKTILTIIVAIIGLSLAGVFMVPDTDKTGSGTTPPTTTAPPTPGPIPGTATTCSDTDIGNNIFTSGVITLGSTKKYEKCTDANTVLEYFCENNKIQTKSVSCPAGYTCTSGACVIQASKKSTCYDSDNGQSFDVAGVVFHNEKNYPDKCTSAKEIEEYYCYNEKPVSVQQSCAVGSSCVDSKCQPTPTECSDTDAKDQFNLGVVTFKTSQGKTTTHQDKCIDSQIVAEQYCENLQAMEELIACGVGYFCQGGECLPTTTAAQSNCLDTDAGYDPDKKGGTDNGTTAHVDHCQGTILKEGECAGDSVNVLDVFCPHGCSQGACLSSSPAPIPPPPTPQANCIDTDTGYDINTKGGVDNGTDAHVDQCQGSILKEGECDGLGVKVTSVTCQHGCSQGACLSSAPIPVTTCMETDQGNDRGTKGSTTDKTATYTDTCSGSKLIEYYCSGGTAQHTSITCPTGQTCVQGACATASTCYDSDGLDYTNEGKVDDGTKVYQDVCVDTDRIEEYYCGATGQVLIKTFSCKEAGLWCSLGACITEPLCGDPDRTNPSYAMLKTTAIKGHLTLTDTCKDSSILKEANCQAGVLSYQEITCGVGCVNGACSIP